MKVGFIYGQIFGADEGSIFGWRQDREQVIDALVKWTNDRGGVLGRQVVATVVPSDLASPESQRAACLSLAQDREVFIAFDVAATDGANHLCYPEQRLPHVLTTGGHLSEGAFRAGQGYNLSFSASGSRQLSNWAHFMRRAGHIGHGRGKLGLLTEECDPSPEILDDEFLPLLESMNIDFIESRTACEEGTGPRQASSAAVQMRNEGVDRVFFVTAFQQIRAFVSSASTQGWTPQYFASDFRSVTDDFVAETLPEELDGALAVSYKFGIGPAPDKPGINKRTDQCSRILTKAGLDPITDPTGRDYEAVNYCDEFLFWKKAMEAGPVNPTRTDFIGSVERLKNPLSAHVDQAKFGPGQYAAADSWAFLTWRSTCRCWIRTGKWGRSRA